MRWRTRIHVPGLQLTGHEHRVAFTTPYGQKLMGMFRYGEWELPAETILGMAGISNKGPCRRPNRRWPLSTLD